MFCGYSSSPPPKTPKKEITIAEIGKDEENVTEKDADSTIVQRCKDRTNLAVLHHRTQRKVERFEPISLAEDLPDTIHHFQDQEPLMKQV